MTALVQRQPRSYRDYLASRNYSPVIIERTVKQPGDIELPSCTLPARTVGASRRAVQA
jgi:hypothetical protein